MWRDDTGRADDRRQTKRRGNIALAAQTSHGINTDEPTVAVWRAETMGVRYPALCGSIYVYIYIVEFIVIVIVFRSSVLSFVVLVTCVRRV